MRGFGAVLFIFLSLLPLPGSPEGPDSLFLGTTALSNRSRGVDRLGPRRCLNVTDLSVDCFTPSRAYPTNPDDVTIGLLLAVSTIGEEPPLRHVDRELVKYWPFWTSRFLSRAPYVFLLLLIQRHPAVTLQDVAIRLNLTISRCNATPAHTATCHQLRQVDHGYEVFEPIGSPGGFVVLLSLADFPHPRWVVSKHWLTRRRRTPEEVARHWRSPTLGYPYQYIAMTTWYAYHALRLQILDFFDFLLKADYDIVWAHALSADLRCVFSANRSILIHTQQSHDPPEVTSGLRSTVRQFLKSERRRCGGVALPRGTGRAFFDEASTIFYSNVLAGWLGFLTSPEVIEFGRVWHDAPALWEHRWTDQQFWCQAVGLFHDGSRVLDLSDWRDRLFFHAPLRKGG